MEWRGVVCCGGALCWWGCFGASSCGGALCLLWLAYICIYKYMHIYIYIYIYT